MSKDKGGSGFWSRHTNSKGETTGLSHRDPKREGGEHKHDREHGHDGTGEGGKDRGKITMHRERGTGRSGNK